MPARRAPKYIFVTGGVLSGLGKGIAAASIGKILKDRGYSVNIQKCDPYLNTDAGTLNPAEHGEVFVTADGAETDLDLGHYERFLDQELTAKSSLMSGKVLSQVIEDERAGKYLGKTVQIIPHVTGHIQDFITEAGEGYDLHIVEVGGTVGDYESLSFIEAIRELRYRVGPENVLYVHVVYLPYLKASKEIKTKPAQNAVRNLRSLGIQPDVLIARSDYPIRDHIVEKLSMFCDVEPGGIVLVPTTDSVYRVPLMLEEAGIGSYITQQLELTKNSPNLANWHKLVKTATDTSLPEVKIGVVAKYMNHEDTYMSVFEAIKSAGWKNGVQVDISWIDAEEIEKTNRLGSLGEVDGIIVPGGFGSRGVEGKITAAAYAMENEVPYLGLCYGMHMAVIALARQAGRENANTIEVDPETPDPVISLMDGQKQVTRKGGTMRLGNYRCVFNPQSRTAKMYGKPEVDERHRHRYEFNNEYRELLQEHGMVLAGLSPDEKLVEVVEMADHPFFVASQYHPEFKSRPDRPHPLFDNLVATAKEHVIQGMTTAHQETTGTRQKSR